MGPNDIPSTDVLWNTAPLSIQLPATPTPVTSATSIGSQPATAGYLDPKAIPGGKMADGSITAAKVLLTDLSNLQPLFNWDDNDVSLFHYDGASLAFSTPAQTNSGASAGIISKTAALNTPGHMRAKESTIFEVKPGEQL
jgi:hypothetical protein